MLKIDLHTHSIASKHAYNTIEEMLTRADETNMEAIAITDHSPGLDNTLWLMQNGNYSDNSFRINSADDSYFKTFVNRYQAPAKFKTFLIKGIECNLISDGKRKTDISLTLAPRFDLIIASIHPYEWLIKNTEPGFLAERLIMAMEEPIDIIGHPCNNLYFPDLEPVVKAAAEKNLVMELNNSSIACHKADLERIRLFLTLAEKYKCRITVSSDAHHNNELGQADDARKLLKEVDFPESLILNNSLSEVKKFITERKQIRGQICDRLKMINQS